MTRYLYIGLALILASMAATYKVTSNYYQGEITKIELTQTQAQLQAERDSTDRLRAAQSLADVLSGSLANSEAAINKLTLEKTREIHHYATGNICLNADLVRLLNTPSLDQAGTMPAATGTPAAENAAEAAAATAPAHEIPAEALTDTDVAEWIANAQGEYATCSSRLSALIDFNNKFNNKKSDDKK